MKNLLFQLMIACHRLVKGVANRVLDVERIRPRNFSNAMLRRYVGYFAGEIINVSGWRDEDGEGGHYIDYFKKASGYTVSNVGNQGKGFGSAGTEYKEVEIDLLKEIPKEFKETFDVVFNHTTLEHIYDFKGAFRNLCDLSRDLVIVVVPVMQQIHHTEDFGDYWRPTTMTIAKMFKENGLEPLVIKCNDQPFAPIYCFAIASKKPELYKDKFPKEIDFQMGACNYGSSLKKEFLENFLKK
ncbi:MAG: hypothetical protein WDZ35_13485 [Crocinitomicaceae bacterium]